MYLTNMKIQIYYRKGVLNHGMFPRSGNRGDRRHGSRPHPQKARTGQV